MKLLPRLGQFGLVLLLAALPIAAQDRSGNDRDDRNRDSSRDFRDRSRDRDRDRSSSGSSGFNRDFSSSGFSSRRGSGNLPPEYTDRYFVVVERNIFVRDRSALREAFNRSPETRPSTGPQRKPEQSLVLTGLALEDDRHVAFIENTSTYTTQRLTSGSPIASGKIVRIAIDHLEYETDGRRVRVNIGQNFLGDFASSYTYSSTAEASAEPTTMPADLAKLDPNDPNLSLVDKMRLRRFQESQKK